MFTTPSFLKESTPLKKSRTHTMNPYTLDPSLLLCLTNVPVEHWAAA